MGRLRISVAGLMGVVGCVAVAVVSLMFASDLLASVTVMLTLGLLTVAILAVVYRREARRAFWLGFVILGWGYMALAWASGREGLVTSGILDALHSMAPARRPTAAFASAFGPAGLDPDIQNRLIHKKLEEPVSMSFANETPLEDVLKYIKSATQGPIDSGIPIYIDPAGLQAAGKTVTSPVQLDIEGIPLRTTLRHMLEQIGLTYFVRDGLLTITSKNFAVDSIEAFRRIGHCYWAILAGVLGGLAGRYLHATRDAS